MKEKITNLKIKFQEWLAANLSTNTPKNRRSTSYDYMRRIERICDKFFCNHDEASLVRLSENIVPVLSLYAEYENKDHYFVYQNKAISSYFVNLQENIGNFLRTYPEKNTELSIIIHDKEIPLATIGLSEINTILEIFDRVVELKGCDSEDFLTVINISISSLMSNPGWVKYAKMLNQALINEKIQDPKDCSLHIHYKVSNENQKNKIALKKFYEYLSTAKKFDPTFDLFLSEIEQAREKEGKVKIIQQLTGATPKQIGVDNHRLLNQNEVAEILECHVRSLKKLSVAGKIRSETKTDLPKYSAEVINAYLKNHHHQAFPFYENVDYSKTGEDVWCSRCEAAKIVGCSEVTILDYAKKRRLTYTNNIPLLSKYYVPELEYLKMSLKFSSKYKKLRKKRKKINYNKINQL